MIQPLLQFNRSQRMHKNSLRTFEEARKQLDGRALEIFDDVLRRGPGTDEQIAARMKFEHKSAVQPRISDLIEDGWLVECGTEKNDKTKKPNRVVKVRGE